MNIQKRKLTDLKPATYNPRKKLKPGDYEFEAIENSITAFGYIDPIIINSDNTVIGGHQRLTVLKHLGTVDEIDVVVVDLPKAEEKALNIALNKINGSWDAEVLEDLLKDIESTTPELLALTGFNLDELDKIIGLSDVENIEKELNDTEQFQLCPICGSKVKQ